MTKCENVENGKFLCSQLAVDWLNQPQNLAILDLWFYNSDTHHHYVFSNKEKKIIHL